MMCAEVQNHGYRRGIPRDHESCASYPTYHVLLTDPFVENVSQAFAKINISTLMALLAVLRRRIPPRYLPTLALTSFFLVACSSTRSLI